MRSAGHTMREIAAALGCGVATIDRSLKRLISAPWEEEFADLVEETGVGAAVDAALSRFDEYGMHASHQDCCPTRKCAGPHISCAADFDKLDTLAWFRLRNLPLDHPVRALWQEWPSR